MIRARAGVSYALLEAVSNGHCGLPEDELLTLAEELLDIPQSMLVEAVRLVFEHVGDHASQWAAIGSIAAKIGCTAKSEPRPSSCRGARPHAVS